jgi:ABC-2 type transport system ATP-binding protein
LAGFFGRTSELESEEIPPAIGKVGESSQAEMKPEYRYAVETHNLTRRFGDLVAVNRVNMEIPAGELFGLLGPNGAGKTTLVRLLTTLLRPSEGTAIICGYDVHKNPLQVRQRVGALPQEPCLYRDLSGEEHLKFFGRLYGVPDFERRRRYLLDLVKLEGREKDLVKTYSGGMKQRLSIACALVHDPEVLFLDEPTAGLDPQTKRTLWQLMKQLRSQGVTIILSTHYLEEAESLSDRVAIIDRGEIIACGEPAKLKESVRGEFKEATLEDVFISLTGTEIRE